VHNDSGLVRDQVIQLECEVSILEHGASKVPHRGDGLRVEVLEHCIGLPPADQFDSVVIDLAA
jgi:hypothetical protein